jgi:myo-inositol 2-dehydrogenase/D-chiro-inositol 1-dehydrogenase
VRLSLAGSGRITAAHGLAAHAVAGAEIIAVASRDTAHATERARQLGARACTYDDLPAGADVVLVATPPHRHAADTLQALERGAAVIVEKPLCTTLSEADAMVAAAGPGARRIGYAENLAFAPIIRSALALAAGLGELRHLEVRALQSRPDWGDFLRPEWGGGALFDLGVHPLAVALLVAQAAAGGPGREPVGTTRVTSVRAQIDGAADIDVDDHAEVELTFDTGLVARVVASWRDPDPQWDLQAASDRGVVRAELLPVLLLERNGESVALPSMPEGIEVPQVEQFGYRSQLETFLADFGADRAPAMGVEFGRTVLDIVCAAYASAGRGGEPVAVPFAGPRDLTPLQLWQGA